LKGLLRYVVKCIHRGVYAAGQWLFRRLIRW
jgi:hypothetical protein